MLFFDKIKDKISQFANNITHPILVNFVIKEMKKNEMSFEELKKNLYKELEKNPLLEKDKKLKKKAKKRIDKLLNAIKKRLEKEPINEKNK